MIRGLTQELARHTQFDDRVQRYDAASLGMWIFLTTEVMFFGVLFTGYIVYRMRDPQAFAEAGHHLYMWIGAVNTGILLASSWTIALAVHAAKSGDRREVQKFLVLTAGLGFLFLVLKAVEYYLDASDQLVPGARFRDDWTSPRGSVQLFFILYFIMTGIHAFHLLIGVMAVLFIVARVRTSTAFLNVNPNTVEMAGLYWHFVDVVWIFLLPLLYLVA